MNWKETCWVSEGQQACVNGVNVVCMVWWVIGGRSDSHPRDPGVSVKLVSGIAKFTKWRSFCCWCECRPETRLELLGKLLLLRQETLASVWLGQSVCFFYSLLFYYLIAKAYHLLIILSFFDTLDIVWLFCKYKVTGLISCTFCSLLSKKPLLLSNGIYMKDRNRGRGRMRSWTRG